MDAPSNLEPVAIKENYNLMDIAKKTEKEIKEFGFKSTREKIVFNLEQQGSLELENIQELLRDKSLDPDDRKKTLARRNSIRKAGKTIRKYEANKDEHGDMILLQAAAALHECPLTDEDGEPELWQLSYTLSELAPLFQDSKTSTEFKTQLEWLENKYSRKLFTESLNNLKRSGVTKWSINERTIKQALSKDLTIYKNNLNDLQRLPDPLGTNVKLIEQLEQIEAKMNDPHSLLDVLDIRKYESLIKQKDWFRPSKKTKILLSSLNKTIDETATLEYDKIKRKKMQQKLNGVFLFSQLLGFGTSIYTPERVNQYFSQPDNDPLRPATAGLSIAHLGTEILQGVAPEVINIGKEYLQDKSITPERLDVLIPSSTEITLKYLEEPENIRPVVDFFLRDYAEALQNYPEADRSRLVDKATDFVNETSKRYQLADDVDHESLREYLISVSNDEEMQDLLGYIVLPMIAYAAENEGSYAKEQWLFYANLHIQNGELDKLIPILEKTWRLVADYDPDNLTGRIDYPSVISTDDGKVIVPSEVIKALEELPANPNYLPPEQYLEATENSYMEEWRTIYGNESEPPKIYWAPIKDKPEYVEHELDGTLKYTFEVLDTTLGRHTPAPIDKGERDNPPATSYFQSEENNDPFTRATIGLPKNFKDVWESYEDGESYKNKFRSSEDYWQYFHDYVDFIEHNGSPDKPILESDLFGYTLVKCNGNLTEASEEFAMVYKLLARFNLETGDYGDTDFYRSQYLEQNIPLILSITDESTRISDQNQVIKQLLNLDPRLIDQTTNFADYASGHVIGSKNEDLAELTGILYHQKSQRYMLIALGHKITPPSAVGITHSAGELPVTPFGTQLIPTENSSAKPIALAMAGLDDIKLRHILREKYPPRETKANIPRPTIFSFGTVKVDGQKIPDLGQAVTINETTSLVMVEDNTGMYHYRMYYGNPDLVKHYSENGYGPYKIEESFYVNTYDYPDQVSPELLEFFLESQIYGTYGHYDPSNYADADIEKVTNLLYEHNISAIDQPQVLEYYLRYGLEVPKDQIDALLTQNDNRLVDAVPYLAKLGYIEVDHPLVKEMMRYRYDLQLEYYFNLSPDDKYLAKQLYPDLISGLQPQVSMLFNEDKISRLPYINNHIDDLYEIAKSRLDGNRDLDDKWTLSNLLPFLKSNQIYELLNDSHATPEIRRAILDMDSVIRDPLYEGEKEGIERIAAVVASSHNPEELLILAPAMVKVGIWNLDTDSDKIDMLIINELNQDGMPKFLLDNSLSKLSALGYRMAPDTSEKVLQSIIPELSNQHENIVESTTSIIANYASNEQFIEIFNNSDQSIYDYSSVKQLLFFDRFYKYIYAHEYIEDASEITDQDKELLNHIISTPGNIDKILRYSELGIEGTYKEFENSWTRESALALYSEASKDLSESERYGMWNDLRKHNFVPPEYQFDRERFLSDLFEEYGEEKYLIFSRSDNSKEFLKKYITFDDFFAVLSGTTDNHTLFEIWGGQSAQGVINHEFLTTLDGYTQEKERRFVERLESQLKMTSPELIQLDSYWVLPYMWEKGSTVDFGPYLLQIVENEEAYDIHRIVDPNDLKMLKIYQEVGKKIDVKYWNKIKSFDVQKYDYLIELLNMKVESPNTPKSGQ